MAKTKRTGEPTRNKVIEERWTKTLADAGWTAIPNIVLDKQAALGLKPIEVNIILQIAKFWWEPGSAPYPKIETLASAIGVHSRTIQKHVSRLVDIGLLEREEQYYAQGGQRSNAYTFKGLIERCRPFAEEFLNERKRRQAADRARIRRKKPLNVVRN